MCVINITSLSGGKSTSVHSIQFCIIYLFCVVSMRKMLHANVASCDDMKSAKVIFDLTLRDREREREGKGRDE